MRRTIILAGPLAAALFVFACEDDAINNPTTGFPEAGTVDTNRPPTDGNVPTQDAGPDGDATLPPQPVTVVVANRKGPRAGITVLFHDAMGAVLETKTTDATGRATSNPAGPIPAMATALLGQSLLQHELLTWTGVEAGDELVAADPEPIEDLGQMAIDYPLLTGATGYTARLGSCQEFSAGAVTPINLPVTTECTGPQNAPIVSATDDNGTLLGYAFKKNVAPPTDGGVVNVDNLTWVTNSTFTVNVLNKPGIVGANARLLEIANNIATPNFTAFGLNGSDQAPFKVAPGYAEFYQASTSAPGTVNGTERTLSTRLVGTATSVTFDYQQALPELSTMGVDDVDKKRPVFSWSSVSTLAGSDGGYVRAMIFLPTDDRTRWTIVVPPGATTGTVKAPVLPPAQAAIFLPDPDAGFVGNWGQSEVLFAEADSLADYKAFKKFQGIVNQAEGTPSGFLPANGSYKTTKMTEFLGR